MKNEAAVELGKSGGLKKSEKKTEACRKNASKPRARWATAVYYKALFCKHNGSEFEASGVMLVKGKNFADMQETMETNIYPHGNKFDKSIKMIEEHALLHSPLSGRFKPTLVNLLELETVSQKI